MGASPHARSSDEPTPAPARFGRFELIERIGAGGMAEVFRAAVKGPEGFHRELVVKRILPQLSARARFTQMFVNEAKISALLTHPNIVQIFEFGESDGAYFIAMESVRGLTLREVLTKLREQQRVMPVVAAAEITREILVALDYAHNLNGADGRALEIVHRDISPSNVMIADTGAVKVLDFGIARAADLMADDEGQVVKGKIAYLAPEQIACTDIDARVDVFAAGCLLHELLTGRVMFRAQNDINKKLELLAQTTAAPSAWNADVPPALDLVVARATARDRNARYTSAADMLADLENYLASFRSSSRAVLRLVRSLSAEAPAADESWGGGASTEQVRRLTDSGVAGRTAFTPVAAGSTTPRTSGATAATRPEKPRMNDARSTGHVTSAAAGTAAGLRAEHTFTGHSSSSGRRGESPTGVGGDSSGTRLGGAASEERNRFARGAWHRRLVWAGMMGLGLAVLLGAVAGGKALWGKVSRGSVAQSATRTSGETFVLVTFVSTPAGARIVDGAGRSIGTTPATLPVTPSQIVVSFRFQMDGFVDATASTVPDGDKTISVELKPVKRVEKPARKPRSAKNAARGR